jgi:STE24 endopeptidase
MAELNLQLMVFVIVYFAQLSAYVVLERINLLHLTLTKGQVPPPFQGYVAEDKLAEIQSYVMDNVRFGLIQKIPLDCIILIIVFAGVLNSIADRVAFASAGYVLNGLMFFLVLMLLSYLIELPFDYYHTFILEQKYGFNRSDLRTWILDNIKGLIISVIMLIAGAGPLLWLIENTRHWWLWAFVILSLIQLVITVLYPILIAPLFNKFEPLEDRELAREIEELARQTGMRPNGVYQMDAGRRSTHSNAYFTGLGKTKRIVLFDTLLKSHSHGEIIAVLAHELGHFKLKHVVKSYILSLTGSLLGFFFTFQLMRLPESYSAFEIDPNHSYVALVIIGIFFGRIGFFARPAAAAVSRHFERQADDFAVALTGKPSDLAGALRKLSLHNMSNLNPHPAYVKFYYSHPPAAERISKLENGSGFNCLISED